MFLDILLTFTLGALVGAALVAVGMRLMLMTSAQVEAERDRLRLALHHAATVAANAEQPTHQLPRVVPMGFQRPRRAA